MTESGKSIMANEQNVRQLPVNVQRHANPGHINPANAVAEAEVPGGVASVSEAQPVPVRSENVPQIIEQKPVQAPPAPQSQKARSKSSIILPLIILGVIGFGAYKAYGYFVEGRFLVTTDDAYIKADTATISAKIPGYVTTVQVANNAVVKQGDLLVTLDAGDYQLALDAAKTKRDTLDATLVRLDRQGEAAASAVEQAKAQLAAAEADAQRAIVTFSRINPLVQSGSATRSALDTATADRDHSAASVIGARAAVTSAEAALAVAKAQKGEAVATRKELDTMVDKAIRDLSFVEIRAPFDGVIGNRAAQVGQYVQTGTRLLAVVPVDKAYIEANFKETQLARILPGQRVDVEIDALPGQKIEGLVQGVSPASGAEFSLLPPENATGNFTKIVQRIPVRISLPPEVKLGGNLRPGLSVTVAVRTRDETVPKPSLFRSLGLAGIFGDRI